MKAVTNIDAVDQQRFTDNMSAVPAEVQNMARQNESLSDLLNDAFGSLYKYQPVVSENVNSDRQLNKRIIQETMDLPEYKQLRNFTTGDVQNSAANVGLAKTVYDALPDSVKDAQGNIEDISEQIEQALDSTEYDPSVLEKLFEQQQKAEQNLNEQFDEWQDVIRQTVRKALSEQENDTAQAEQAMASLGWGKSSSGKLEQTDPKEKTKVMQALKHSKKLQEIMKLAGRMTNIAEKKQRQKAQYFRTEVVGIEQGDDISNLLPSEYGYLMHGNPALKNLFLKRLSQAELLQYEMESREPKAKGPVIVEIDCSGSMTGEPDTWSKACALAMYSIARRQKRDFSVLLFDTEIMAECYIKKGEHKPADLIGILTAGTRGGTSFERPLSRALELIKTEGHTKADLLVLTDGICDIADSFKAEYDKQKKALEFSCYCILIGGGPSEEKTAKRFADTVTSLNDMMSANEGQAFSTVFSI